MTHIALKRRLEAAIGRWDRRNKSHHAGPIALLRFDEAMVEIEAGRRRYCDLARLLLEATH